MERIKKILDQLKGHRTHITVFICLMAVTTRFVTLSEQAFIEGLKDYAWLLVGAASVLLGSKAGEALKQPKQ